MLNSKLGRQSESGNHALSKQLSLWAIAHSSLDLSFPFSLQNKARREITTRFELFNLKGLEIQAIDRLGRYTLLLRVR
jgi:hypothetical protein